MGTSEANWCHVSQHLPGSSWFFLGCIPACCWCQPSRLGPVCHDGQVHRALLTGWESPPSPAGTPSWTIHSQMSRQCLMDLAQLLHGVFLTSISVPWTSPPWISGRTQKPPFPSALLTSTARNKIGLPRIRAVLAFLLLEKLPEWMMQKRRNLLRMLSSQGTLSWKPGLLITDSFLPNLFLRAFFYLTNLAELLTSILRSFMVLRLQRMSLLRFCFPTE